MHGIVAALGQPAWGSSVTTKTLQGLLGLKVSVGRESLQEQGNGTANRAADMATLVASILEAKPWQGLGATTHPS
jgi:ElaB/YqjD/DUF883 family membrane-anchored ribosome-binding protein